MVHVILIIGLAEGRFWLMIFKI